MYVTRKRQYNMGGPKTLLGPLHSLYGPGRVARFFFSERCFSSEIWTGTQLSKFPKNRSWNFHKFFMSFYKNEQERCCEALRSQNDQTASENLPKETLPAHHQQKLTKKCFFIFIQIFYFFLPCKLSHLALIIYFLLFFRSRFYFDAVFISGLTLVTA